MHVWFSPKCGPWSRWSNLNGSRSVESWDAVQHSTIQHLDQVALGIVLMRHQRSVGRNFHWEQPRNSHMFRLPYMQEVRQKLMALEVDLCTAGDMRDPDTQLHKRKSLTIMTTSTNMHHEMDGLKWQGQHTHQQIEGTCHAKGKPVWRTSFTEITQKVCTSSCQVPVRMRSPRELPYLH